MDEPLHQIERAMVAIRRRATRRTLAGAHAAGRPNDPIYDVLDVVEAEADAATVTTVATALQVDQPRASRLVAAAVEAGLIRRVADQSDGRRARLERTDQGRAAAEHIHAYRRDVFDGAMSGWSDDDRATFARLLTSFVAQLPGTTRPLS
ncbi:MarR family winged helix-turn-helix transcriptional regulator [Cryptosporangium phraense]|uniref:MarR family transcriptional regulator n=1 Tax=Cryptosporangium phraense TaxID=2593070 RepID=A0A545AI18_9ACTN|nr:MarR family transcriptional regulator [Cryptosporangium phraense]TQS40963.1 MarR family transcriptional regulator [Cryptosporangium phraense]